MTIKEVKDLNDFGQESDRIDDKRIEVGWWKYRFNDQLTHIIYKTFRRSFIFLHKPYFQGIKIVDDKIEYLNDKELGDYD